MCYAERLIPYTCVPTATFLFLFPNDASVSGVLIITIEAMTLLILGMNHRTASQELRGRVAFSDTQKTQALHALIALDGVTEAVIVSTCNRTELYVSGSLGATSLDEGAALLQRWLERYHHLAAGALDDHLYAHAGDSAVAHAIRVASGLDSLVLGEPQIFGQVKQGYQCAQDSSTLGPQLDSMFQHAFSAVKQVRSRTGIGEHTVSVAYTAVQLAGRIFDHFERATALLVGAGDTIALVARHLKEAGIQRLIIANRTVAHAEQLAHEVSGEAIALASLPEALMQADIVISSTASPTPVLTYDMVRAGLKARRYAPLFMADIAVPCDIEPSVGTLEDVFLYSLDDFNDIIDDHLRSREQAANAAELVIEQSMQQWRMACRLRSIGPMIRRHREQAEQVRQAAEAQAMAQLARGHSPEEVIQRLSHQLTNRLLHGPTTRLRDASREQRDDILTAFEHLLLEESATATSEPQQGTRSR